MKTWFYFYIEYTIKNNTKFYKYCGYGVLTHFPVLDQSPSVKNED